MRFRRAQASDLAALRAIEGRSVQSPWPKEAYRRELELPQAELWLAFEGGPQGSARPGSVPRMEAQPVGLVIFCVVGPEISLLNIAVDPAFQRRGIGLQLLDLVERRGRERGGRVVFLEVRVGNGVALALYHRRGSVQVGIRKGYYSDNGEDALVLSIDLGSAKIGPPLDPGTDREYEEPHA